MIAADLANICIQIEKKPAFLKISEMAQSLVLLSF